MSLAASTHNFFTLRFLSSLATAVASWSLMFAIFQRLGRIDLVGVLIILEWLPRILLTITGSSLIYKAGVASSYIRIEVLRTLLYTGLIALLLIPNAHTQTWFMLILPLLQVAIGIHHCIGEAMMQYLAPVAAQQQSQVDLRMQDYKAKFIAFPVSAILVGVFQLEWLPMAFAAIVCATCAGLAYKHKAILALADKLQFHGIPAWDSVRTSLPAMKQHWKCPHLTGLSMFSILLTIPTAAIFAIIPFYLATSAQPGWLPVPVAHPLVFIGYLMLETIVGFIALKLAAIATKKWSEAHVVKVLLGLYLVSIIGVLLHPSLAFRLVAMLGLVAAYFSLIVLMRVWRQFHIPEHTRMTSTGIAISIEATSYILAGCWLALMGELNVLLMIPALIAVGMYWSKGWTIEAMQGTEPDSQFAGD